MNIMDEAIRRVNKCIKNGSDELNLSFLNLDKLPKLPNSLQILYCWNNKLTKLPKLPNSLKELCCYNNKLLKLPKLPDSLRELDCYNNNLTELPIKLKINKVYVYCDNEEQLFKIGASNYIKKYYRIKRIERLLKQTAIANRLYRDCYVNKNISLFISRFVN